MTDSHHETPAGAVPRRPGPPDRSMAWVAGVLAVLSAAVTVALFQRLANNARWMPFVGWLVAGAVVGLILRHRAAAVRVAVGSTLAAALVTGFIAWLASPTVPTAQKHPALNPPPGASEVVLMTSICSLAAVLGATAVAEYYRWQDRRP